MTATTRRGRAGTDRPIMATTASTGRKSSIRTRIARGSEGGYDAGDREIRGSRVSVYALLRSRPTLRRLN